MFLMEKKSKIPLKRRKYSFCRDANIFKKLDSFSNPLSKMFNRVSSIEGKAAKGKWYATWNTCKNFVSFFLSTILNHKLSQRLYLAKAIFFSLIKHNINKKKSLKKHCYSLQKYLHSNFIYFQGLNFFLAI